MDALTVIDADLKPTELESINSVHVWYALPGDAEPSQSEFPGHDFFMRWLPAYVQKQHTTLKNYWYGVHPQHRNEHIAQYLLDRANQMMTK